MQLLISTSLASLIMSNRILTKILLKVFSFRNKITDSKLVQSLRVNSFAIFIYSSLLSSSLVNSLYITSSLVPTNFNVPASTPSGLSFDEVEGWASQIKEPSTLFIANAINYQIFHNNYHRLKKNHNNLRCRNPSLVNYIHQRNQNHQYNRQYRFHQYKANIHLQDY